MVALCMCGVQELLDDLIADGTLAGFQRTPNDAGGDAVLARIRVIDVVQEDVGVDQGFSAHSFPRG